MAAFGSHSLLKNLAPTPPMGFNTWNWFGKAAVNEKMVREVIDAMASTGLRDAGYTYVVVDGGWRDTKLGPNGELLAHPVKFPGGMKALADYAHAKGLKFGVHTVPGTHDCAGDPVGGFGREEVQLQQFVDWGLDFIKLDKCQYAGGWNEELLKTTYLKWTGLLNKSERDILFNVSAYEFRDWNPEACNMSRTTPDIMAKVTTKISGGAVFDSIATAKFFWSVMHIAEENNKLAKYARPGYWNDAEMLVTGDQGLTLEEQKIHFALWGIMSAPLFIGSDPRNMPAYEKNILLNKTAIQINQDPTEQGTRLKAVDGSEIWTKKLKNGDVAVLFFNRNHMGAKNVTLPLSEVGIKQKVTVSDVYAGKKLGEYKSAITRSIPARSCLYLLVKK
ncbi:glycoside hydrolase family 27 protein [Hymenobacter sp.]|uniref:glycoside hydrolase family 27 protein n=1 Tax=Hymenobacter sp. TaxID=1898978 RepID=UPI00286B9589|nr:glycoside hydrolase family 27 protein [Hymenobacter sp.]